MKAKRVLKKVELARRPNLNPFEVIRFNLASNRSSTSTVIQRCGFDANLVLMLGLMLMGGSLAHYKILTTKLVKNVTNIRKQQGHQHA
jgi:hypothetical protein